MSRQWLRLVGRLSLAIFLIANGPVNVVTLACLLPPTEVEAVPGSDCRSACCREAPSGCCCATEGERCGHGRRVQAEKGVAGHSSRPPCPVPPGCPSCPAGCCGLCAAKVPCCLSALQPVQGPAPCLGASSAEQAVAVPSILPDERFHPPRA